MAADKTELRGLVSSDLACSLDAIAKEVAHGC